MLLGITVLLVGAMLLTACKNAETAETPAAIPIDDSLLIGRWDLSHSIIDWHFYDDGTIIHDTSGPDENSLVSMEFTPNGTITYTLIDCAYDGTKYYDTTVTRLVHYSLSDNILSVFGQDDLKDTIRIIRLTPDTLVLNEHTLTEKSDSQDTLFFVKHR